MQPQIDTRVKNMLLLGGLSLVLGILFEVLFWGVGIGLNVPVFVLLSLCVVGFLSHAFTKPKNKSLLLLWPLIAFFSSMVCIRSSELLTFFNILGTILLLLICIESYQSKPLTQYLPEDYLRTFLLPLAFFGPLRAYCIEMLSLRSVFRNHPVLREVLRGTIFAVIALSFFTWLLSSADIIFHNIVLHIFVLPLPADALSHLIVFLIVSAACTGAFAYAFIRAAPHKTESINSQPRTFGSIEMIIFLGSLTALFFVFIALQLTYLFGGESHVISQGLTYADYARKGFFELVAVALAAYGIVSVIEKTIVKSAQTHLTSFKILSSVLILEVLGILLSAFQRLSLYESMYGFSTIRLYSHALMIWIGVILILLSHHILTAGTREQFTRFAFVGVVLLLISMNVLNPDAFIAKKNIERFHRTGNIDTWYLASLSDDMIPYTVRALTNTDTKIKDRFITEFFSHHPADTYQNMPWQSYTFSHAQTAQILSAEITNYTNHPDLITTQLTQELQTEMNTSSSEENTIR